MHDDYSDQYITNLIDRLNQQIEDTSTIRILTTYLDFTEQDAKKALANAKFPEPYANDDNIGSVLLDAEDSGDKQDVFNVLDTDYYIYKIVMSK
ncbi:hypothetical protein [Lactobacillus crispatus]|jgi:hypothetical protein|uniref:hypothetical protein n=1 Tax=Lactobacillus crispatus TaxID=47770 RepID=UPI000C7BF95D|nr:hypothetical protein [Lactobacillus crispatus]MCZ9661867.1 hypothetical protein [Lactobacillus crispatus]PKZ86329.1 hypothetical protein CYJ82_11190 [Lactobacillus crispatus]TDN11682.1 hypothetical protein CEE83_06505 [Lactobacillus crispatus]DAX36411.1 MAG TPA: hypothetical protein [Caudoviricetes sp.]